MVVLVRLLCPGLLAAVVSPRLRPPCSLAAVFAACRLANRTVRPPFSPPLLAQPPPPVCSARRCVRAATTPTLVLCRLWHPPLTSTRSRPPPTIPTTVRRRPSSHKGRRTHRLVTQSSTQLGGIRRIGVHVLCKRNVHARCPQISPSVPHLTCSISQILTRLACSANK